MVRRHLIPAGLVLVALALRASAAEPPHYTFSPPPPGQVTQSLLFYPAGEGMQSQWRAVASRAHLGGVAYQWYLSIYAIDFDTATYHLKYQSPRDGGPLSRVTQPHGGPWLPLQTLHVVGVAELERPAVQDLVVQSHEASADCGGATVSIFSYDWTTQRIRAVVTVSNSCDLTTAIVNGTLASAAIVLKGPYYAPGAPLCCPTRESATATLRYRNGKWVESPSLFPLSVR